MIVLVAPNNEDRRGGGRHGLVAVAHVRLMVVMLIFAAGCLLILGRLAQLAISAEPSQAHGLADGYMPPRGDIVDRNGAPLAQTIDAWSIGVHPRDVIGDKRQLAMNLADVMPEHDAGWYWRKLNLDTTFTYLARRALPATVERVNALGEPAIALGREPERLYPQSELAAHVLGFVGADGRGMRGIERAFNDRLTNPAKRGDPLQLSIDMRVQGAMQSQLAQAMATFQAKAASGIVMNVHTGEVVAMVSMPTFNPNNIKHATDDQLRNNVTQSTYELGSTFKPLTVAEALDTGTVGSIAQKFDATKPLKVGAYYIHDDPGDEQERWLNVPETLIYSSNIATARIADLMGEDKMRTLFRKLRFDEQPTIELREKGTPQWPTYWARTTTMTTAFGHGIAVTPLQLATAYGALVNGGILREPTLIKVPGGRTEKGTRIFSEATSARMRQMLRLVVLDGTGKKGSAPGYRVGGKTGTAEMADAGGYAKHRNVSTFAAAFPMDNPQYVVLATLVAPVGTKETYGFTTAAWNAAPVVRNTIERAGPLLGVVPNQYRDIDVSDVTPLLWHAPGEDLASAE